MNALEDVMKFQAYDASSEAHPIEAFADMDKEQKQLKLYELRLKGVAISKLQEAFGICRATAYSWLHKAANIHRIRMQATPAADFVADSLLTYKHLEFVVLNQIEAFHCDGLSIDPKTGEIDRSTSTSDIQVTAAIAKLVEVTAGIRKKQVDLMRQTGLLPSPKEGDIHADWTGTSKELLDVDEPDEERSTEDIEQDVERLLMVGRRLA